MSALRSRGAAVFVCILLGASSGCRSDALLRTGSPPAANAACAPDATNPALELVACGFAPTLSLVGVDETAVYALTAVSAIYRVEKATGIRTQLYTFRQGPQTPEPK